MVCEPILMVCSVTEDSSLEVAGSHLSGALVSGLSIPFPAPAPPRAKTPPTNRKIPPDTVRNPFSSDCSHSRSVMARRPPTRRDCTLRRTRSQRKGPHRGPRTIADCHDPRRPRDIRPRSDGSRLLTENAVWPFQSCVTLSYEGDGKKKTSPRPDTASFSVHPALTF